MTLPLGNPALKLVHTNQFLWCPLPDEFDVENFEYIANELSGRESRYGKYEKGRWYIEGVTINNDGSKFTMEKEYAWWKEKQKVAFMHGHTKKMVDIILDKMVKDGIETVLKDKELLKSLEIAYNEKEAVKWRP